MDALEKYVAENDLSIMNVLKFVDDYSIYSFYIGAELELNTKYSSPLRLGDEDPSFSLYYSKYVEDKILYKDSATGLYGDVFDFVRQLMTGDGPIVPVRKILLQINSDFGLGLAGDDVGEFKPALLKKAPLRKEPITLEVTSYDPPRKEFYDYWNTLDITKPTVEKFDATHIKVLHFITNDFHKVITPKNLAIGYEILGLYKSYQPFAERQHKFRNNFDNSFVEGALQLDYKQDFAIITKSMKECMWYYEHFEWEAVAGLSETTMINPYFMEHGLKRKYKKVFIWLDPDSAGRKMQQKYLEMYPWLIPIQFDDFIPNKDVTDFYTASKKVGVQREALQYVEQLVTSKL
jgi:hypothetical protein